MKNDHRVIKATGLKFCHSCGIVKMVSDYHAHKRSADRLQTRCKRCQIEAVMRTSERYREANRDKIRTRDREHNRMRRLDPAYRKREAESRKLSHARAKAAREVLDRTTVITTEHNL